MFRFFDLANAISLAALLAAAACSCLAISRFPAFAVVALMLAGLLDLFDGPVARRLPRTDEQRRFGRQIDSLVDVCSFGFAPLVLLFTLGLNQPLDWVLLGLFVCCAVWRLAYFEAVGTETVGMESAGMERTHRYFTGLPTTYVALVLPLVFLTAFAGPTWLVMSLRCATLLLALAMVAPFRVRKPGALAYGMFVLLAVCIAVVLITHGPRLHQVLRT